MRQQYLALAITPEAVIEGIYERIAADAEPGVFIELAPRAMVTSAARRLGGAANDKPPLWGIVSEIGEILAGLNRDEGLTILFVEQKLPFARKFAQHFAIMERGHTVASGAMTELSDELVSKHLVV